MEYIKKLLKSKTVIVAVLQAGAGALLIFNSEFPNIGYLMTAKSFIDVVLRVLTTIPIYEK